MPVRAPLRFDRRECSGAFGDIGTDLPLLAAMVLAAGMSPVSVFVVFGAMQVLSGFIHRVPMPVQPLKMVAVIVIARQLPPDTIAGAGLAIGAAMLLLTVTGLLDLLARVVPKPVVRGMQLGLGLNLATVALSKQVPAEGTAGLVLAAVGFVTVLLLMRSSRWPPALIVLALGGLFALATRPEAIFQAVQPVAVAGIQFPSLQALMDGFVLLALPQIPLSIGNSILATRQIAEDHFPEAQIGIRRIGLSYAVMNFLAAPLGCVPVCHGSGGMAGHVAFGARTGGSVVIYGIFLMLLGVAQLAGLSNIMALFPLPILGVILFVEALALALLVTDLRPHPPDLLFAVAVGCTAWLLPNGFLIGMIAGSVLYPTIRQMSRQQA